MKPHTRKEIVAGLGLGGLFTLGSLVIYGTVMASIEHPVFAVVGVVLVLLAFIVDP